MAITEEMKLFNKTRTKYRPLTAAKPSYGAVCYPSPERLPFSQVKQVLLSESDNKCSEKAAEQRGMFDVRMQK